MNATAIKLVIKFWHDDQPENPCDEDGWKVYSFSQNHASHKEPEDVGFDYDDEKGSHVPDAELKAKLDNGLAHFLSYYEHGQCLWSLSGEGSSCPFDSVRFAGLLVWEGDPDNIGGDTSDKTKDARSFINRYTLWCNGEIYGFTMEAFKKCGSCGQDEELGQDEVEVELASCGGYYSDDFAYMLECVKENIGSDWADYEVEFKEQDGYGLADEAKRLWKGE